MRVPIKWLSDYVSLVQPIEDIARRLTMAGLEVTGIERTGGEWNDVVVGHVLDVNPHPDADRLRLVKVDTGDEQFEVVCGAPNVAADQKIAYAKLGARLKDAHTGEPKKLKKAKIRGVVSVGMVCSERELGLSEEHEGILVLSELAPLGVPLAEVLGDTVLEIDMKPNRADGLSVIGVARDIAVLSGERLQEPEIAFDAVAQPVAGRASVRIDAPELCRRFTLAIIEDIKIGPSPPWMQERLTAAGMRPISNVVDITNYVMLELGQPIHAFDYDAVKDHSIIVRKSAEGEELRTLDGQNRRLSEGQLLITDPSGPIAVAGVMGGLATEVTEKTKTILLEVANFDPVSIRRTAMALKLPSEASKRFAWGVAPELAPLTSRRATEFLVKYASGRAAPGIVDAYPSPEAPAVVQLPKGRIPQVLGINPSDETVSSTLSSLGFDVSTDADGITARVPYWRRDVRIADDLVEEVARVIGYETIPTQPLEGRVPTRVVQPRRELRERVRDILAGAGMQEVITYPLTSMEVLGRVVPGDVLESAMPLAVVNPLNVGQERLRTTLRASLLEVAARNLKLYKRAMALFETARVYLPGKDALPDERERVTAVVTGYQCDRYGVVLDDKPVDFYGAKSYIETLFEGLHLSPSFEGAEHFGFAEGRTASVKTASREVGVVGQIHPKTAALFEIEVDVFVFDVELDALVALVPPSARFTSFSRFPAVEEALALVVAEDLPAAVVIDAIEAHGLVSAANVFDEYRGEQVASGKKSLAVSVSFQAPDRTLTDKEVAKAREKILAKLRHVAGAELRG